MKLIQIDSKKPEKTLDMKFFELRIRTGNSGQTFDRPRTDERTSVGFKNGGFLKSPEKCAFGFITSSSSY